MSIVRTPAECIRACLANLTMARDAHQRQASATESMVHHGAMLATDEAIALIRTECHSILEENQ